MRVSVWAYDLARGFWNTLGVEEGFPRAFERAWVFPVTVKRLPRLTLASIRAWLAPLGIMVDATPDRALCGCLAGKGGQTFIYRESGVLPARNAAPPGSSRPIYRFPLESVVKLRTDYETEEPTPRSPMASQRRQGRPPTKKYKHVKLED